MTADFKIPVVAVVQLKHIVGHLQASAASSSSSDAAADVSTEANAASLVERIQSYRAQYGVEY